MVKKISIGLILLIAITVVIYSIILLWPKNALAPAGEKKPENVGGQDVACTMEAKQCPDGSYVGRKPPKCEFASCPGEKEPNK